MQAIVPHWPAPSNIHAFTTTRAGGVSKTPYDSFNLAAHVGDDSRAVKQNRILLREKFQLPSEPAWLQQTHSTIAIEATSHYQLTEADASYTCEKNRVCAVLTADCLPLLVCNRAGTEIAAIHAGWRGLADGVIEATIAQLKSKPENLLVWLGPAMGPQNYQVGPEVKTAFIRVDSLAEKAFVQQDDQHWLVNLYHIARQRLQKLGITAVYGGEYCTFSDSTQFFSYRRNNVTGRMASLIWLE